MYLWRGVIHILEFDPQATTQERLLDCLRRGTGQQHWNGAEFIVAFDGTIEDVTHLFALPRPVAIRPDKDHSASSIGSPGTRFLLSRKGFWPFSLSMTASGSTADLSALL
jgi:hypothetical protein